MDVIKTHKKTWLSKKTLLTVILLLVIIMTIAFAKMSYHAVQIAKKDLLISDIKHGDLNIIVEGYGVLASEKLQLITTLTSATVKEIVLKPGANVTKNSVIVRLENPELHLIVESAEQELTQLTANLRQLKVSQTRELLTEQALIAELQASFDSAKLKREAEQKLVADGIISDLTFKQSQLNEKQLGQRITLLAKRLEQLSLVHTESINIQVERIKQQEGRLTIAQNRLKSLEVTAGFDGVLQRLSVNLGQSLAPGEEVALIGSTKELIAEIKIPQSQASQVKTGQKVIIDTRQEKIIGVVARIDPIVKQNTVSIDVALPKHLPDNAKPQQNIDAEVITSTLSNINYIERPVNILSQSESSLYQLNNQRDSATLRNVKFGKKSGRFIEVLSDVKVGDVFIISDLSNYKATEITLH